MNIREELFNNQDLEYKQFHSRLVPNIDPEKIIGVRLPVLRKIAKQAAKYNSSIDDYYYEEKMLRGLVIGYKKAEMNEYLNDLKEFIPLIDNWAVCDCSCSGFKFTKNNKEKVWNFIQPYLNASEYEIRFAVVMMMEYYLDDEYIDKVLSILSDIKSQEYYVNMAVAWALSVAFVKFQSKTMPIIEGNCLSDTVKRMTIQKICDSYRVDKETKLYLKSLRPSKSKK